MTALALTQRRRTGTALIAVGALLVTVSVALLVSVAPRAEASDHCITLASIGTLQTGDMGLHSIGSTGVSVTLTKVAGSGVNVDRFSWSTTGGSITGSYSQNSATHNFGPGTSGTEGNADGNRITNLEMCAVGGDTTTTVADTTTTSVADTTTTSVLGPEETTTTAGDTTTTVAGPDDPELPDTGAGELLALLVGGLGLTFIGSGSLVIAGDRRRVL